MIMHLMRSSRYALCYCSHSLCLGIKDARVSATKLDLAAGWTVLDFRKASVRILLAACAAMSDGLDRSKSI